MSRYEIERQVRELGEWFHNMELGGVWTAPHHFLGDYPRVKWQRFAHVVPEDLSGMTVLDVGCNAGFYALEMKRRGADRVVEGFPRLHFIERRYAHDETNWWVPNRACAEAMLRAAGFAIESHPEEEVYLCRRRELGPAEAEGTWSKQ